MRAICYTIAALMLAGCSTTMEPIELPSERGEDPREVVAAPAPKHQVGAMVLNRCEMKGMDSPFNVNYRNAVQEFWPESLHDNWCYLRSQALTESNEREHAISWAGAHSVLQTLEGTALETQEKYGIRGDFKQAAVNIRIGAAYMSSRMEFWTTPRTDAVLMPMAHCCYNAGCGSCYEAQKICISETGGECLAWEDIEPYLVRVTGKHSEETRNYIPRIRNWNEKLGGKPL